MMKSPVRFFLFLSVFAFSFRSAGAQTTGMHRDSLVTEELHLKMLADSMSKGSTDRVRAAALAEFNPLFFDLLLLPSTFDYGFDSLKSVSVMKSPDGRLKVYSWMFIDRAAETYTYFGVVQAKKAKTAEIKRTGLVGINYPTGVADTMQQDPNEWFGAVYYDIAEKKAGKEIQYVLLGWRAHDKLTTRKVIEVITLNEWGDPTFGLPVFSDEKGQIRMRHVFEYSSQAVMLLRFEKKKNSIVFDHLSAPSPGLKGQYHTYGPDFTYDGYRFKKGKWLYQTNLELNNPGQ